MAMVGGTKAVEATDYWTPVIDELAAFGEEASNAASQAWWKIFLLGFPGGLVALLTPCVWPIIPMTVSFFLKRSGDKRKGVRDAATYGVSIVVIYVLLGLVITGIFGASALNALSTNAVFNIFFCLLLLVFAASFFGAFEITLPSSWSNAVDSKATATTGLLSIFLMAFTLALVSFSCTGPIIGFLLVEVSTSGSILAPTIGMLGFAIALPAVGAALLFSVGASGGGTDVIAMILKKYSSFNIGMALFIVDLFMVVSAFFVFDTQTGLFSFTGLMAKSLVIDGVIENINLCKYFTIVCDDPQPICDFIMKNLNRSATVYKAEGAYAHRPKTVILTVMKRSQAVQLRNFVRRHEPGAFITITNSSEIIGKGFRGFN